jgi:uncharacterized repeat protein (TIGR03803 family)
MKRIVIFVKRAAAVTALGTAIAAISAAQTLTTVVSFNAGNGSTPEAVLVQGTNGYLYGTTLEGGADGGGSIFKMTPAGQLNTLDSFCQQTGCANAPYAGLVQAVNGNFFGTTDSGGAQGDGTVFKMTPSGTVTILYSFCSQSDCTDGAGPAAGLVEAPDGDLYGTTTGGGTSAYHGGGTVFKITLDGTLTTLHRFCAQSGCPDGERPVARMFATLDGDLYGTTASGGAQGSGTVFKITPGGPLATLYSFCAQSGCADGATPYGTLIQAENGDLYGTTDGGGAHGGGTIFKITTAGTLTTLYSFCTESGCADGENPEAGLVLATDGNLYGVTFAGGLYNYGSVFKISPDGGLTTLYSFCPQSGCTDGQNPIGGLMQYTNGDLYGTTYAGGNFNVPFGEGTVFSLSVGLGPFVKPRPNFGKVGAFIEILGTDLTGATSITFNGVPAQFTALSATLITATVPAGATAGTIEVVTSSGTLSGNVPFRVVP